MQMAREQSLAEHSFNVAQIAMEIGKRLGWTMGVINDAGALALNHDIDEVLTGDAPTPSKEKRAIKIERVTVTTAVKIADLLDAAVYVSEYGLGRHAGEVKAYCEEAMHESIRFLPLEERRVVESVITDVYIGTYKI